MEQFYSDLIIHFYVESGVKPKTLSKMAAHLGARHEVYRDLKELTNGLAEHSKSPKDQIIVFERQPELSDHHTLNIIRNFPSIVLDDLVGDNHSLSKKHPYWKANSFILGSNLETVNKTFLEMSIAGMFPNTYSIKDGTPWNAASKTWDPVKDVNRKLSVVLERFLDATCPKFSMHHDIIEFTKYIQNRAKGRGTFKTIGFDFIADASRVVITAKLDWHNKSEQSLRVLYSGLAKSPYSNAYINISSPKELEITGVWDLSAQHENTKTLMVSGLPGVKLDKKHLFIAGTNSKLKISGS